MKLEHRFTVPAPFDAVWSSFDDLEGLVPCVPGAALTSAEGDEFAGTVKVKLGPISMTYNGTGRFVERDRGTGRVVVEAKGKDKRGNGTAGATVVAQVTDDGDSTSVDVTTDLTVTGKPAQFGRGVIQDVSNALLAQFVDCFSAKLAAGAEDGAGDVDDAADSDAVATDTAGAGGGTAAAETLDAQGSSGAGATHSTAGSHSTAGGRGSVASEIASGASGSQVTSGAAPASSASQRPESSPPLRRVTTPSVASAAPAELNLLGAVMPVLARRAALPIAVTALVVAVIALFRGRPCPTPGQSASAKGR